MGRLVGPRGRVVLAGANLIAFHGRERQDNQLQVVLNIKYLASLVGPFVLTVGLGLFLSLSSRASGKSDCDGTTVQITECLEREYREVDSKMNHLYRRVLDKLGPSGKQASQDREGNVRDLFVRAQRAWLSFRDEECKARYSYFSQGSMGNVELLECRIELTGDRIKLLDNWLELLGR